MGHPLTLLFDPLESIVLFLAVITVNYTVADGRSNWLEGAILCCLYVMVAVIFWYYPGTCLTGVYTRAAGSWARRNRPERTLRVAYMQPAHSMRRPPPNILWVVSCVASRVCFFPLLSEPSYPLTHVWWTYATFN
jgi:hypothetical protein